MRRHRANREPEPTARSIPRAKQFCPVKAALGLPKAVLLEPKLGIGQKTGCGLGEPEKFLLVTGKGDRQGLPAVQGQNAKQGRGIHLMAAVADLHTEGLFAAEGCEILNIPERMKTNREFLHKRSPPILYKLINFVYNWGEIPNRLDANYYSRFLCIFNCRFV